MLRRSTKIQLILFVVITLIGVSYVSANYVGLTKKLFDNSGCTVRADFPDSGGIFSNAEVTYRGVTVGKVGALRVIRDGVQVDLDIDDCGAAKIPASTAARVSNRSVVGEQYVDLLPPDGDGPYLRGGETLSMDRNSIPTATQTLLMNIDQLARSVDASDLATTVQELGYAFNDRGVALGSLLDSTNEFVDAASANLSPTVALIDQSATVLRTQLDEASSLRSFTASLDLLARQLKTSDRDVRRLLDSSPQLSDIRAFIQDNRTDLGVTIANLADIGDLLVQHRDGLEQVLELYPILANGGPTVVHDNKGALGLVSQTQQDPPDCGDPKKGQQGYQGTTRRTGDETGPIAPNVAAHCTAPVSSGINVRGSANVPGGDPIAATGGGVPYPRVNTSNMAVGTEMESVGVLGDRSWQYILTDALR